MSQHDMNIANLGYPATRIDINAALAAIASNNSGATEPSAKFAYMWWPDTTSGLLKIRNADNSAWVTIGTLADANLGLLPSSTIGSTVQGYDSDTAKTDVAQTFSATQTFAAVVADSIQFDTISGDATSNTLDDYETGSGTAVVQPNSSGSITLATPTYEYTKVGNLVTFQFEFHVSASSSPVGALRVNLPFAGAGYATGAVRLYNVAFSGSPFLAGYPNNAYLLINQSHNNIATSGINSTGYYFGTFTYRTNS